MRRNACGECHKMAMRKRLANPSRLMEPVTAPPRRRRMCATPFRTSLDMSEKLRAIWTRWIVERHRAIGCAIDELAHERVGRCPHRIGRALRDDPSFRHEVEIVDDSQRFVHIVRDHDRGRAQRIVEPTYELAD